MKLKDCKAGDTVYVYLNDRLDGFNPWFSGCNEPTDHFIQIYILEVKSKYIDFTWEDERFRKDFQRSDEKRSQTGYEDTECFK